MSAQRALLVLLIAVGCAALGAVPAAAQGPEIKIKVTPSCEKGDSQFEIVNVGEAWPKMAKILLLRTDTQAVVAERTMRMRPDQRIVYRAKDLPDGLEIGLRIEPEWYKRTFAYDAVVTCAESPASEAAQPPGAAQSPAPK